MQRNKTKKQMLFGVKLDQLNYFNFDVGEIKGYDYNLKLGLSFFKQ